MAKTKQQLIEIRESSYKPPPFERCVNCKHFGRYGNTCHAIQIRNKIQSKKVSSAGVCDLFEAHKATKE